MTNMNYKELADELYDRTIDFINEEVFEMLYDKNLIEESDDRAIHMADEIIEHYFKISTTNGNS